MTDIKKWYVLKNRAFQGDNFVEESLIKSRLGSEYQEFIRLNHVVMEACHAVHNSHMLG